MTVLQRHSKGTVLGYKINSGWDGMGILAAYSKEKENVGTVPPK
jgi:hypothetical protein